MNLERLSHETLLNSDGDIVPPDDVPGAEDLPENREIIENQFLKDTTEQDEQSDKFSDKYKEVVALIEAGIEKSRGYGHYKVDYDGKLIRLDIFLATTLFKMDITSDERKAIIDTYSQLYMAHEYAKHAIAIEEPEETITSGDDFEAFYNLYDQIESKHPGGAAEIREATKNMAIKKGISIPPDI